MLNDPQILNNFSTNISQTNTNPFNNILNNINITNIPNQNTLKISSQYEEHYETLRFINLIIEIISLISCSITILTFLFFKSIRSFVLELVFYLTISSFFQTIAFIIYFPDKDSKSDEGICQLQAFSMQLFGLAQFLWTCLLSYTIYQSVINLKTFSKKDNTNLMLIRLMYFLVGFGIPLIISLFGLIFGLYGKAGFWCFINTEKLKENLDNKFQIFYLFTFIFLWCCIMFNLGLYSKVIKYINNSFDEEDNSLASNYTRPLMMYTIIQILCLLPSTINRLYQVFEYENIEFMDYIQSFCDVSQGLLYSIAFGFNPAVRKAIGDFIRRRRRTSGNRKLSYESGMRSNLDYTGISILDLKD